MALKGIKSIEDFDIENKVVFIRCDFNVPMNGKEITDDLRIRATLPTIEYARAQGAKIVLGSHLGRPKTEGDRESMSLEPVADKLREFLDTNVYLVEDPLGEATKGLLSGMKRGEIILLENLRFTQGEVKNSHDLSQTVSEYAEVYINDAFGASHRAHSSISDLAKSFESRGIGFLMKKEIEMLSQVTSTPVRPYVAVLGGAKVSDKIEILDKLIDQVDTFLIGGAMAYTFLKAKGISVGASKTEEDKITFAKTFFKRMESRDKNLLLPIDHVVAKNFTSDHCEIKDIIFDDEMALDIGPKTIASFSKALEGAKTVFWNGPMGVFENSNYAKGTFSIAEKLSELTDATTIVGGGDSAAAAIQSGFSEKMTHISTGGGASLEFLQGVELPGLSVLRKKNLN